MKKTVLPISVVITLYNDQDEIVSLLNNISEQTVDVSEIIITDGGSTDNTVRNIEEFSRNSSCKIRVFSGKRLNISQGLNEGIKNSKEETVCIMAVGNLYPESFIEKLNEKLIQSHADVICPYIKGIDTNSFAIKYNEIYLNGNNGKDGIVAPNHGCIARKKIFYDLGFFYERFIYAGEDAEFYTLARNSGATIVSDSETTVFWDTPHSFHELKRQIRAYSIANLQWHSSRQLLYGIRKPLLFLLVLLCSIVVVLFTNHTWIFLSVLFLALVLLVSLICMKISVLGFRIQILKQFYPLLCYLKNIKYRKKEYRVNRKTEKYSEID